MATVTNPILLDSTGQEIVTALETIAENMGTSAGHTIQNDSGTDMQRRDKLQFKGVYVEDDQINNKTVVNVTRQMTLAEFNQLTAEQKKGLINVTDQQGHTITASDVPYDSNTSVKDKIDEITLFETVTTTSGTWQVQKIGEHLAICYITINKARTFASAYGNFYFATGEEIILPQLGQSLILGVTAQRVSTGVGGCIVYKGNQYFNLNKVTLNVFNGKNETINDDDVSLIVTFYIP